MRIGGGEMAVANRLELERGSRQPDPLLDLEGQLAGRGIVDPRADDQEPPAAAEEAGD